MTKKYLSQDEALLKMQHYCAYQERCQDEVRSKLIECGVYGEVLENIIAELITDNFLNEERFAKTFATGKFRQKKWGLRKIQTALKSKGVSDSLIAKALQTIDKNHYRQSLHDLLEKKAKTLKETDPLKRRMKLQNFLLTKGYEPEMVIDAVKAISGNG